MGKLARPRPATGAYSRGFQKTRARAPLRLGFAGGGTDLSPFCDEFGGAVLNATIDRYAFASILPRDDGQVVFAADDLGLVEIYEAGATSHRELLLHVGVYERMIREFNGGEPLSVTVKTTIDAPAGSGLGSSSALVVALVEGFRAILGAPISKYEVAHLAFSIEREDLALAGGRQDQYAAAFGGLNYIEFLPKNLVIVNPLRVADAVINELESSLVVCFSGRSRKSADIIEQQTSGLRSQDMRTVDAMHKLKSDAFEMKQALLKGDIDLMAEILNSSWTSKKETAKGVSTDLLNHFFDVAMANGALGGKVSGAGGGGFIFFLVHPENRFRLIAALNDAGGMATPAKLTDRGCETWLY